MSYFVRIDPLVSDAIEAVDGFSAAGRSALADAVVDELGRRSDDLLALHPTGPESLHFRYDCYLTDSGLYHQFDFVVDGTQMAVGVVTVVFVEHTAEPLDDLL